MTTMNLEPHPLDHPYEAGVKNGYKNGHAVGYRAGLEAAAKLCEDAVFNREGCGAVGCGKAIRALMEPKP